MTRILVLDDNDLRVLRYLVRHCDKQDVLENCINDEDFPFIEGVFEQIRKD